ncbi:MAG: hypothetical protein K2K04_07005, partial [Clostridia bacterium]|nr:hypothetical protein [Clostridia bacterium]
IVDWPSYNLIKNCTSYNNYDNETYGENADGFAAKLTVGYGNIFDGCIAYRNSDDGWDLFAKTDSGNIGAVIIYNCVAFENGYLAETQEEFHENFPNFNKDMVEVNTNSYLTKDGDGNGFKLGGSIMEGDVFMYNCLSFNNRMHGVTDNSNPGVLSVSNTTSYNNSAGIDDDPTSPTFGQIIADGAGISSDGKSGNINLARHDTSYNLLSRVLSVNSGLKTVSSDEYRGAVEYSYLDLVNGTANKIGECVDASNRKELYAVQGQNVNSIKADIFAQLPVEWAADASSQNVYNISGKGNSSVHADYRNEDGSVNMGNMLKITDYSRLFGNDNKIGADLSQSGWSDYTHYGYFNASNADGAEDAEVKAAVASLYLNTNVNATFQDFDLVVTMQNVDISWTSSDPAIKIDTNTEMSASGTKDARAIVYRGSTDKTVTLTATVTHQSNKSVSMQREFVITLKADIPTIGDAIFDGVVDGTIILDQYDRVSEPAMTVRNAADYNGKLLQEGTYQVETSVRYAVNKNAYPVKIRKFTTGVAGIYYINKKITLGEQDRNQGYTILVASTTADVQFVGEPSIIVNQNGYTIGGELSTPTGSLYSYSSAERIENITAEQVIENGKRYDFRAESINFQFENANTSAYYIYYVMCNAHGDVTCDVQEVPVTTQDINTVADFKAMLLDNNSSTIYMLKADLDLSGETKWAADVTSQKKSFYGVLNGLGHTIKNFSVRATDDEQASLFYRLAGGTVENIRFENFNIDGTDKNKVGIFATTYGGYIYNVEMKNVVVSGGQRVGALIGQIMNGELHIDQVSLVNDARYEKATVIEADFGKNIYYVLTDGKYEVATEWAEDGEYYLRSVDIYGERSGAIVGDIQASSATDSTQTYISNCYVDAVIGPDKLNYSGSIVGRNDDRNRKDRLEISQCFSRSIVYGQTYVGGIIGSGNNTGAGVLRIKGCAFIGDLYYSKDNVNALTAPLKNCSGIVGRYSSVADSTVTRCYAKFEDSNANYDVDGEAFTSPVVYVSIIRTRLEFSEDRWNIAVDPVNDYAVVEPYATLKFLGNWD